MRCGDCPRNDTPRARMRRAAVRLRDAPGVGVDFRFAAAPRCCTTTRRARPEGVVVCTRQLCASHLRVFARSRAGQAASALTGSLLSRVSAPVKPSPIGSSLRAGASLCGRSIGARSWTRLLPHSRLRLLPNRSDSPIPSKRLLILWASTTSAFIDSSSAASCARVARCVASCSCHDRNCCDC